MELNEVLPDLSNYIILAYRGSLSHGMFIPSDDPMSTDDVDLMGAVIPPLDTYLGLKTWSSRGTQEIKKDEWDIVVYELRKVITMLLGNNPNIFTLLWVPEDKYLVLTEEGRYLRNNRDIFSSLRSYNTFVGYAHDQLAKLENPERKGYMGEKRKALFQRFGFDSRNASHCIRLLRMGTEFLQDGVMRIDRTSIDAEELIAIKRGEWELDKIKSEAARLFELAKEARNNSPLPSDPDEVRAHEVLMNIMLVKFGSEMYKRGYDIVMEGVP